MDIDGDSIEELVEIWNNNGHTNAAVNKYDNEIFRNISNNRISL